MRGGNILRLELQLLSSQYNLKRAPTCYEIVICKLHTSTLIFLVSVSFETLGLYALNDSNISTNPVVLLTSCTTKQVGFTLSQATKALFQTSALEGGEGSVSSPGSNLPPGKTRYPLYRRLGGPQGLSGLVRKISPQRDSIPGPSSPQAVANIYNYAV